MDNLLGMGQRTPQKKNLFDSKNNVCLMENCKTYANTKRSIKRYLKNCNEITKNRKKDKQKRLSEEIPK